MRKAESPMDEKLAELERELRRVRKNIRTAARGDPAPRLPRAEASGPEAPPLPDTPRPPPADARHGELFAYASRGTLEGSARRASVASVDEKRRFAHYFASGSFVGGMRPLREVRRVQRNKAIFMIVLVLIVGFVIFSLLR